VKQLAGAAALLQSQPIALAPYDAELFGHWWFEGPDFLDRFLRQAAKPPRGLELITPSDYLDEHPVHQAGQPSASSWGEGGYWSMWLSGENQWIYRHLEVAQEQMTELVREFAEADAVQERALRQAGRELLLAQASDWPFILRTGTSPDYARSRIEGHLASFKLLLEGLRGNRIDEAALSTLEEKNNVFPELNWRCWR
jgi:1,4-alpha-glucan branching enzyme